MPKDEAEESAPDPNKLAQLSHRIKLAATHAGFDDAGIAPAHRPAETDYLDTWLAAGYAGSMGYINKRRHAYDHPEFILGGSKSVLVLVTHYNSAPPLAATKREGKIARYAWGEVDYHKVIRGRLKTLNKELRKLIPEARTRGIVDTAPLFERHFARAAGLGWIGKNSLLLSRNAGSLFFLAAVLLDQPLAYDPPMTSNHCGTCTACLDICPTDAFVQPGVLDASKCISYLTIEHRDVIPSDHRDQMNGWIFGCDDCQDVCPWNRHAPVTLNQQFWPQEKGGVVELISLLSLDVAGFDERFGKTPLSRPGRAGVLHSAAIALGRAIDDADVVAALVKALNDAEPLVRAGAAWSLGKSADPAGKEALLRRAEVEVDARVKPEIVASLARLEGESR
jgi:epoxyqueuosine reductase